jgi:HD-GYP domain-containing protein (c-di-GMP phosphodiesterase class II)
MSSTGSRSVRLNELIAALSLATDLGLGEPMEHVLRSCLISMRLGERIGLTDAERAEVYYVSLLAWVGCMSDSSEMAAWFVVRAPLTESELDIALEAIADFTDLKSVYFSGHSRGVANLAADAARHAGFPERDVIVLRRAGLVHDLGRSGVPNTIWDKPGPITFLEWERVRLHPYYTERVLARVSALARVAAIAVAHHERLDGSGYHRGLSGGAIGHSARLLAAADAYQAMGQQRAYRPALAVDHAAAQLRTEVCAGRLAGDAVEAVLHAAGQQTRRRPVAVAGLTVREVQVLSLFARGVSNRNVAKSLSISEKTVGNHVEHIYTKIGVSTRPAATLFALQHGLLDDPQPLQR